MMKTNKKIIALSVSLILLGVILSGCTDQNQEIEPTVEITDVDITHSYPLNEFDYWDWIQIFVTITIVVHNPTSFDGTITDIDFGVSYRDEKPPDHHALWEFLGFFSDYEINKPIMPGSTDVSFSFTIEHYLTPGSLMDICNQGYAWVLVNGHMGGNIKGDYYVSFDETVLYIAL